MCSTNTNKNKLRSEVVNVNKSIKAQARAAEKVGKTWTALYGLILIEHSKAG
jgi:hypothetical protein